MDDDFKVIETVTCEDAFGLIEALQRITATDPRGKIVGEYVAVCIDYKHVQVEVCEFADGTRAFVLSGV